MKLKTNTLFKGKATGNGLIVVKDDILNKVQNELITMLEDVILVLNENNINYCLCGGSALGAYRHSGFIPWDDDIDIFMTRKDLDRFNNIFQDVLGDKYVFQTPRDDPNHRTSLSQIRKKNTVYRTRNDVESQDNGFFIDVFTLDNTYNNKIARSIHGILSMFAGLALSCRKCRHDKEALLNMFAGDKDLEDSIKTKSKVGFFFSFASLRSWCIFADKVHAMCKNNKSKYVVCPAGRRYFFGEIYERGSVCNTVKHSFCTLNVNIPKDIELYLSQLYGTDFMVIPEKDNRDYHAICELKFSED